MPVFKTGAFNRSAIPPARDFAKARIVGYLLARFNTPQQPTTDPHQRGRGFIQRIPTNSKADALDQTQNKY